MKAKAWRLYGAADARLEDIELEGAGEECHDDVVAHEVAAVHDGLCALAQGGVGCHLLAQEVAGGDVQEVELLGQ